MQHDTPREESDDRHSTNASESRRFGPDDLLIDIGPENGRPQRPIRIETVGGFEIADHFNPFSALSRRSFITYAAGKLKVEPDTLNWLDDGIVRAARDADKRDHMEDDTRQEPQSCAFAPESLDDGRHGLPEVVLPGGATRVTDSAATLGSLLSDAGTHFNRGGALVRLVRDGNRSALLRPVKPAALASDLEKVAALCKIKATDDGFEKVPTICQEATAKLIMSADGFLEAMPPIAVVSPCPVLVDHGGRLVEVIGYDRESQVLAFGQPVPDIPLEEAVERLNELVADFRFATPGDRSRALASVITPGLLYGGILRARAACDLGEADASQTGKGYRNKLTASVYGQLVTTITQRKGGVGSLEEKFDAALVAGANFIALDNVRGLINSPAIESFLTEDRYMARTPFAANAEIDSRRVVVMVTSNQAELTKDLSNRSSCVRILKQPEDYDWRKYAEGKILSHVRANPSRYLAAVFAVIRAWHAQGMPRSAESRHDFREWAQTLDWIVVNLLGAAPLMEGHREAQTRITNPSLTWLRLVAIAVIRAGRSNEWLRVHQILDVVADALDVEIPGVGDDADIENEETREKALLALGRRLAKCFCQSRVVEIDHMKIERGDVLDEAGRTKHQYRFTVKKEENSPNPPIPPMESQHFEKGPHDGAPHDSPEVVRDSAQFGTSTGPHWGHWGDAEKSSDKERPEICSKPSAGRGRWRI